MKNNSTSKIYTLGKKLGLNREDIDFILIDSNARIKQASFSTGPPWYPSGRYGTISIKVFEIK